MAKKFLFATAQVSMAVALVLLITQSTRAQSTDAGTVSMSGSVAAAFRMSSGGAATVSGVTVTGDTFNTRPLAVTLTFGDVGPANTNSIVYATVPVQIRSNAAYKVVGQMTANTFNAGDTEAIHATDVGFGVLNLRAAGDGAGLTATAVSGSTIAVAVAHDPVSEVVTSGLRASYPSTLNSVSASTQVLSGPRLTKASQENKTNNGLLFDTKFAIVPQYFSTGSFSATLTLTISAP